MAAAAIVTSGYQTFFAFIDVLFFKVATFLPNLMKIGQEMRERHQFIKIQDGGSRHVEFRLEGASRCDGCIVYRNCYIPTKLDEDWSKFERGATVSQNSKWWQPPC